MKEAAAGRARAVQRQVKAVMERIGVIMFRAEVHSVDASGRVYLVQDHNLDADASGNILKSADVKPSVRISGARRLRAGDWVWCLRHNGHNFVLGRLARSSDVYMDDVAPTAGSIETRGVNLSRFAFRNDNGVFATAYVQLRQFGFEIIVEDGAGVQTIAVQARAENGDLSLGLGAVEKRLVVGKNGNVTVGGNLTATNLGAKLSQDKILTAGERWSFESPVPRPRTQVWVLLNSIWQQIPVEVEKYGVLARSGGFLIELENNATVSRRVYVEVH